MTRPGRTSRATFKSTCAICDNPIEYVGQSLLVEGQPLWRHQDSLNGRNVAHLAQPELRYAIDATCPGCDFPEIGFAPSREKFVCSRCEWTGDERPSS